MRKTDQVEQRWWQNPEICSDDHQNEVGSEPQPPNIRAKDFRQ